jgi:hypothetical protein
MEENTRRSAPDPFCITVYIASGFCGHGNEPTYKNREFTGPLTRPNIEEHGPSTVAHSVTLLTSIQQALISVLVRGTDYPKSFVV